MAAYPYTGSGYGGAGVPYANDRFGQFFTITETEDIVTTAAAIPVFKTLGNLLAKTGLDYELKKGGPFTVFAPTDDAFASLLEPHGFSTLGSLLRPENVDELRQVLLYHVVRGEVTTSMITAFGGKIEAETMSGDTITVMGYNRRISVGSAAVGRADLPCTNGIVHVISSVLTPPSYDTPPIPFKEEKLPVSLVQDPFGMLPEGSEGIGIAPGSGTLTTINS